eukprot:CAMPEP_0197653212 /NCGR_PEP_ID=MMETSP1338-20131121/34918_1 /TAXON_ID=43686 ORGANISM="Pelagodinium beii, Strain RCC1491" /NCGR_SAMPLE_ID=MMETSP1338 /ASSEMBLY_ACC=CAM_ASM_000754 /LENGTH=631 /DNA_ID=CAMNT_0043228247 /DNA_START=110 /DNA_END=2005 /DNA_ORIENTATION=-
MTTAQMSTFSKDSVLDFLYSALYAMRVEISFLLVFSFLWLSGAIFGGKKSDPSSPTKARTAKKSPDRPRRVIMEAADEIMPVYSGDISEIASAKLKDPEWIVPQICQHCRTQVQRAFELYHAAATAGLSLKDLSEEDRKQLLLSMVTSTIRVGQAEEAIGLLKDLREQHLSLDSSLLVSATKICTSKQLFAECVMIYDFASQDKNLQVSDKSVWSCLLFCAVETKSYGRCRYFFDKLCELDMPSPKDFGNMVRLASSTNNWELALQLVGNMRKDNVEIDSVIYNTVLATCVSAEQLDKARGLLDDMVMADNVTDVITYNTLAKGYAKAGNMEKCYELYEIMRQRGLRPSQVTYGILLDGFINDNEVDKAMEIFDTMHKEDCQMNTVLYTTLIKGFARAGQVDQACLIYEQMRRERGMQPDVITFSILIKANCDVGRLQHALKLLTAMKELCLKPDEVVFNNLLGGCTKESDVDLAQELYDEMISSQVKPSVATYSILIRLYVQCKRWDEAVNLLRNEVSSQRVTAEPRLYGQLAQCCLRERQGRRAVEVYKLLTQHSVPTASMNCSLLGMCAKLNMLDTGAEIMILAAQVGSKVNPQDAALMLEVALKKKKPQVMQALKAAMVQLKLPVSA